MFKMYYDDLITEIETIHFNEGIYTIRVQIAQYVPYEPPPILKTVTLATNNIENWNSKDWKVVNLLGHGIKLI